MEQEQTVRLSGLVRSFLIVSMVTGCSFASTLFTSPGGGADRQGDALTLGTGFTVRYPRGIPVCLHQPVTSCQRAQLHPRRLLSGNVCRC